MALSPILGAFTWGEGGSKLTPEEIAVQRALFAKKRLQGVDTSPVASPWQGAARLADAFGDVMQENRLGQAAAENAAYNQSQAAPIMEALYGGITGTSSPVAAALTAVPGAAQEMAATSPSPVVADGEVADYIRQSASARGIDPDIALRVAMSEGGVKDPIRQSGIVKNGVREPSYGPFQLYMGGGLGNKALEAGIDPRDPNQWRQGVDFALDQAAKGGWSPWYGAAKAGVGNRAGLDGARPIGFNPQAKPSAAAAAIEQQAPSTYVDPTISAPNYVPPVASSTATTPDPGFDSSRFGNAPISPAAPQIYSAQSDFAPPLPEPRSVSAPPQVASVQPAQVAQNMPQVPRALIAQSLAVMQDPRATPQTKSVAQALLERQQSYNEAAQKQALAEQQRQQVIARRQVVAQQTGINPAYAQDEDIWKAAAGNVFAAPSTSTVGANVIDNRTGKPIYQGTPEAPVSVQEFEYGTKNPAYFDNQERLKKAGSQSITIGGGDNKQVFDAVAESATTARSAATGLNAIREARNAVDEGIISGAGANARLGLQKVGALLGVSDPQVIQNTETFRSAIAPQVSAMMKATVGSTQISNSDRDFAEKAAGGSIELDSGSIKRLLNIMEKAGQAAVKGHMERLDKVYPADKGFDRERALFGVQAPETSNATAKDGVPQGVDAELWKYMTPEEKRLFQ